MYQPKTGQPCTCRKGTQRDNCPACEGTGWRIDFAAGRARNGVTVPRPPLTVKELAAFVAADPSPLAPANIKPTDPLGLLRWHVSGAIERGEGATIDEVKPAPHNH